jgi:cardiolipin synthase A/B
VKYPARDGNRIDLLNSGAEYFPALLAAIEAAKSEIFLEAYIYAEDDTAMRVTEVLAAAARRGVAVRVLVDGFGARDLSPRVVDTLERSGSKIQVYRRPLWWQPVRGLRRMHRKLVVIDNTCAFVGGINIVDDWNTPNEVPPRFDFAVRIAGPLAHDVGHAAWHLWIVTSFAAFRRRSKRPRLAPPQSAGNMRARLLIRDNLAHRRDIEDAYMEAICSARESILISIAYFLPSRRIYEALRDAAARGVGVRILLQGPSDHPLLKRAGEFLYRRLQAAGVTIFEYRKSFLHAKVAVVDRNWATVGSSNLDPFSLLLSREANIEILDAGFAARLEESLQKAMVDGAHEVTADTFNRAGRLTRLAQWASYRFTRVVIDALNLAKKN